MPLSNPFVIEPGQMPPCLAGREEEIRTFLRCLEAGPLLALVGLRGTGKTVLLRRFAELSSDKRWLALRVELSPRHVREAEFVVLFDYLVGSRLRAMQALGGSRGIGFTAPHLDGFAPTQDHEPDGSAPAKERLSRSLRRLVESCRQVGQHGVALLLDEFQFLRDDGSRGQYALSTLIEVVSALRQDDLSLHLVVSGLPSLRANLAAAKTYSERMFRFMPIESLDADAVRDAIATPLASTRIQFDSPLLDRLVRETRGYAYFIQFFPYFLIDNVVPTGPTIRLGVDCYESLRELLLQRLDEQFHGIRFERASDDEQELLLALADLGAEFAVHAAAGTLRWDRNRLNQMLRRLVDKEILVRVARGRYGYALPLFDEFLTRARKRRERP